MHPLRQLRRPRCCALLIACTCAAFAQSPAQRHVFAHYMLANQDYVADSAPTEQVIASYQREIQQAQAIGIDGFALNAGGWRKEPRYIRRASEMFEAAVRLNSGFTLFFSADMCCSNDAADVEDMVRRFANNPRYSAVYYQQDGRFLLTTFAGEKYGAAFWQQLRRDLETGSHPSTEEAPGSLPDAAAIPSSKPLPISLIPAFFWGGELPTKQDIDAGLSDYKKIIDGAFYWGIAAVPGLGRAPDQIPSSDAYAAVLHHAHKLYMAPICFQFWGANAGRYYEYSGFAGMRKMWMDAINVSHPDAVEIITWNDFIEGTYVSPIDDPAAHPEANDLAAGAGPPATLHYFHTHRGATELLAYFIAWYKTGKQPQLHRDSVFWAYRTVLDPPIGVKVYGPIANLIYFTANLTAPATLRIRLGDTARAVNLPAGSTDIELPLAAGPAPIFDLLRGEAHLATAAAADPISSSAPFPDLYYSTGTMAD